jgi:hypothetical protein
MITVNFTVDSGETSYSYSFKSCGGTPSVAFAFDEECEWCHISRGDNSINIKADAVPSTQSAGRTAKVNIFVNGNKCSEFFSIIQQGHSTCDCNSFSPISIGATVPSSGAPVGTVIGTYKNATCLSTISIDGDLQAEATNGEIKLTQVISSSDTSRTFSLNFRNNGEICASGTVTQTEASCTCDDFSIGSAPSAWGCDETSSKEVSYTSSCVTDITATCNSTHFTASVDTARKKIIIKPISTNSTTSNIIATVSVGYKANGSQCTDKTFTVAHNSGSCSCNCDDFSIGSAPTAWNCEQTEEKYVTYSTTCVTDITASCAETHFTVEVDKINKRINVKPNTTNTSTSPIEGTVIVSYTANGQTCTNKTFTVTHNSGSCSCGCDDFYINTNPVSWSCDSVILTYFEYTCTCLDGITATCNSDHFIVDTSSSGYVSVQPTSANESSSDITATLTISYQANGNICLNKEISLTHSAGDCNCSCSDFIIETTSREWACDNLDTISIPYTASCSSGVSVYCTSDHFQVNVDEYTKYITVYPKSNNSSTSPIVGTVKINYKAFETQCDEKEFTVTHNTGTCSCNCNDFQISTVPNTWDCGEYTTQYATYACDCLNTIAASCDNTHFSISIEENNHRIAITPNGINDTKQDIVGTVTVSYTANGQTCTSKTFEVRQATGICSCKCDEFILGEAPSAWDCDAVEPRKVSYSANCLSSVTVSCDNTHFDVKLDEIGDYIVVTPQGYNRGTSDITGTVKVSFTAYDGECSGKAFTVTQTTGICSCKCDEFILGEAPSAWDCDERTAKEVSYTGDCITDVVASCDNNHFNVSVDRNNKRISIEPIEANKTKQDIEGTVKVTFTAYDAQCNGTSFTVKHNSGICSCECGDFILGEISNVWSCDSNSRRLVNYTANCASDISIESSNDDFMVIPFPSSFTVRPVTYNETDTDKTAVITVKYKAYETECSTSFTVTQTAGICSCKCNNLILSKDSTSWDCSSTDNFVVDYSADCTTNISVSSNNAHFRTELNASAEQITIYPIGINDTAEDITGTVTVSYSAYSATCSQEIALTHLSGAACQCSCDDFKLEKDSETLVVGEETFINYSAGCTSDITVASSDENIVEVGIDTSDHSITIDAVGAGTATITVSYKANDTVCTSKTINVTVSCKTYTITPDKQVDYEGGEVTFSAE